MKLPLRICGLVLTALLVLAMGRRADAVNVTLDLDPAQSTSGQWTTGQLIELTIRARTDGGPSQGFYGADFRTGQNFGIRVADTSLLKLRDVQFFGAQVDTETNATSFNGNGSYSKAGDTWVYEPYTAFVGAPVLLASGAGYQAVATAQPATGQDAGIASAVNFLHLVFEVQSGFAPGTSTSVSFRGQVMPFNPELSSISNSVFGTVASSDMAAGSFTLTNVHTPEPVALPILAAALALLMRRRRSL